MKHHSSERKGKTYWRDLEGKGKEKTGARMSDALNTGLVATEPSPRRSAALLRPRRGAGTQGG